MSISKSIKIKRMVHVCMYVCVFEREKEREGEIHTERERE